MSDSGKVMKRKNPYMVVDVTPFRDTRLSWKAKGLMTYFLDKPENWTFYLEHIFKQAPDGEKAVRSGIKELMKFGYIVRVAFRDGRKVAKWEFLVYEQPVKFPSEKPIHVNLSDWQNHLEEGGDIDITLFAQKRKVEKKRAKSLLAQNLQVENLQVEKLHVGNAGLLNTNNTNQLYSAINKDYKYLVSTLDFQDPKMRTSKTRDNKNSTKEKQTKEKNTSMYVSSDTHTSSVFDRFKANYKLSNYAKQQLKSFLDAYGELLVTEALERAISNEAQKPVGYIKGVLKKWEIAGVKTLEDIQRYEDDHRKRRGSRSLSKVVEPSQNESAIKQIDQAKQETAATLSEEQLKKRQAQIKAKLEKMREQQKKVWAGEENR